MSSAEGSSAFWEPYKRRSEVFPNLWPAAASEHVDERLNVLVSLCLLSQHDSDNADVVLCPRFTVPCVHLRPVFLDLLRCPLAVACHLDACELHLICIKVQLSGLVVDLYIGWSVLDPQILRDTVRDDRLVHPSVLSQAAIVPTNRNVVGEVKSFQPSLGHTRPMRLKMSVEPFIASHLVRVELDKTFMHVDFAGRLHESDSECNRTVAEFKTPQLIPPARPDFRRPSAHLVAVRELRPFAAQPLATVTLKRKRKSNHIDRQRIFIAIPIGVVVARGSARKCMKSGY